MKKRGYFVVGILVIIFLTMFALAAEGYLTGTTGYWTDKDENILGSEIITLDDSQLEGAFGTPRLNLSFCEDGINICSGGQQTILTENIFKTYVTGISEICPDSGSGPQIYFEVYEKDDSAGDIGEDGTDDPIRVGASKLNGIIRTVAPNCLSSVAIAPWAISLNDITNAGTETDGIYEFYYKAITSEGYEKDYNNTILNINITSDPGGLIENLSKRWLDFDLEAISTTVQFDSVDLAVSTPSIDNSVYFEITGFPIELKAQTVNVEIYENDSADGSLDDEIRTASTDTGALIGTIDETGKLRALWKLTEEDIINAETEDTYEFYAKINVVGEEASFKDTPVFIEINDVASTIFGNADAAWKNSFGNTITALTWSEGSEDKAYVFSSNIDAPQGTQITIEIYEKDAGADDEIRTGVNALTDDVDANGRIIAQWTITRGDFNNSGSGGTSSDPWKYYFKLIYGTDEVTFEDITLDVNADLDPCINKYFCSDYQFNGDCTTDACNVTIEIPGINCSTDPEIDCYCDWNETAGACAAQWSATAPGGNGTNGTSITIGSCGYDENTAGDTCEDDGFLSYSWTALWSWDPGNSWGTLAECLAGANVTSGCVQDGLGVWHYDPENQNLLCIDGENSLMCPAQVELSGFSWVNWVLIAIALVIIYFIIVNRRKKNKVEASKKK